MSIWRTMTCPKCGSDEFNVADNGIDYELRILCMNCDTRLKNPKEQKLSDVL